MRKDNWMSSSLIEVDRSLANLGLTLPKVVGSDSQVGAESDGRKALDIVPFKESLTDYDGLALGSQFIGLCLG
ncbi:hypothetical protein ACSBR1_015147 [Camellia fascicularis]